MSEAEEKIMLDEQLKAEKIKHGINSATAGFKLKSAEYRFEIALKFAEYGDHAKSAEQSLETIFEAAGSLMAFDNFDTYDNCANIKYIVKYCADKNLAAPELIEDLKKIAERESTNTTDIMKKSGKNSECAHECMKIAEQFLEAVKKYIAAGRDSN